MVLLADQLYLILNGSVKVQGQTQETQDIYLSTLHTGDFFGECVFSQRID